MSTPPLPYPSLLIVTRPQTEIDYPLWDAARNVWADHQPSLLELTNDLEAAGFCDITHTLERYPASIKVDRWQSMVRNRFWSTFSHFTNEELDVATCQMIQEENQYRTSSGSADEGGVIHFEDRLLFISARKKAPNKSNPRVLQHVLSRSRRLILRPRRRPSLRP
jgi:hypothetical protein